MVKYLYGVLHVLQYSVRYGHLFILIFFAERETFVCLRVNGSALLAPEVDCGHIGGIKNGHPV